MVSKSSSQVCLRCQSAVWALQSQWLALFLDQPGAGRAGRGHSGRLASHIVANHVQPLRSGTANPVTWRNTAATAAAALPFTRSYRRALTLHNIKGDKCFMRSGRFVSNWLQYCRKKENNETGMHRRAFAVVCLHPSFAATLLLLCR